MFKEQIPHSYTKHACLPTSYTSMPNSYTIMCCCKFTTASALLSQACDNELTAATALLSQAGSLTQVRWMDKVSGEVSEEC